MHASVAGVPSTLHNTDCRSPLHCKLSVSHVTSTAYHFQCSQRMYRKYTSTRNFTLVKTGKATESKQAYYWYEIHHLIVGLVISI